MCKLHMLKNNISQICPIRLNLEISLQNRKMLKKYVLHAFQKDKRNLPNFEFLVIKKKDIWL